MAIKSYVAIAMQPSVWDNMGDRKNNLKNIEHGEKLMGAAIRICELEGPVKLIAFPEGWLQGFSFSEPERFLNISNKEYAHKGAITLPGEETDKIGEIAKKYGIYLRFHADTVEPEWPDLYFAHGIIIDPQGKIVNKRERHHSSFWFDAGRTTPHDVWDEWVKKNVKNQDDWKSWMDAIFPVADTDIGKLGSIVCGNSIYPEESRGLAMNGAEVIIKCNYVNPWTSRDLQGGDFTLLSRMHALVNTVYTVNPNCGLYNGGYGVSMHVAGGYSCICDYFGRILDQTGQATDSFAAAVIDIEALREHRSKPPDFATNSLGMIRTEVFRKIYEQTFYPKNLHLKRPEIIGKQKELLAILKESVEETFFKRGLWTHAKERK
jgi:predicted amidohydrolase